MKRLARLGWGASFLALASCSAGVTEDEAPDGNGGSGGGGGLFDDDDRVKDAPCTGASYDFPGNGEDEDCSGTADDASPDCDGGSAVNDPNPVRGANALGLCRTAEGGSWGILSAAYVKADGTAGMNPLSHGLLGDFGPVQPRQGNRMLVLSTGPARDRGDAGFTTPKRLLQLGEMNTSSAHPAGFPAASPSCPGALAKDHYATDPAALELRLRVPANAQGFRFEFNLYTAEYPGYICKQWNDFFVVLQSPAPPGGKLGNIAFDGDGNFISVNSSLLDVCAASQTGGKDFLCPQGTAALEGTGYEEEPALQNEDDRLGRAATGWLTTASPVTPGSEVTLRFAVWDQDDANLNTTVLIDHFEWLEQAVAAPTTERPR